MTAYDFTHLSNLLKQFTENEQGPAGCACGVAKDGDILFEDYRGYADLETGRAVAPDTVFRMYSMTKVVVCAAALILYERGQFLLNEPIGRYLPEFSRPMVRRSNADGTVKIEPAARPILIKHAFAMTAGIPYPFDSSETGLEIDKAIRELRAQTNGRHDLRTELKAIAQVPLAFEPGTGWLYGYGHDLIGGLIEVVSGKPLGQFLQDELFKPLGMNSTGYRYRDGIAERMASFYRLTEDGKREKLPASMDDNHQPDAVCEAGGIGLYSTLRDYLVFSQMLACGGSYGGVRILGRKTIDLMRANQLTEAQRNALGHSYYAGYGYGLGVRTLVDPAAGNANVPVGEFGWSGMAGTYVSIDPSERFSVVYMHQLMPNMEEYHHLRVRAAAYAVL